MSHKNVGSERVHQQHEDVEKHDGFQLEVHETPFEADLLKEAVKQTRLLERIVSLLEKPPQPLIEVGESQTRVRA